MSNESKNDLGKALAESAGRIQNHYNRIARDAFKNKILPMEPQLRQACEHIYKTKASRMFKRYISEFLESSKCN